MKKYQNLSIEGAILDEEQLKSQLEKIGMKYSLKHKTNKNTYPIPQLLENYKMIKSVYNLLNEHIKLGISIHPAGEWLLDNFYIIEETIRQIEKEITIQKYTNFVGIQNGKYAGFARIYVLATEIVAYTDNKIDSESLKKYLQAYQTIKTLNMEEIWNIGTFLQIAIIENIREICEKIYNSQMQKFKAEKSIGFRARQQPCCRNRTCFFFGIWINRHGRHADITQPVKGDQGGKKTLPNSLGEHGRRFSKYHQFH